MLKCMRKTATGSRCQDGQVFWWHMSFDYSRELSIL